MFNSPTTRQLLKKASKKIDLLDAELLLAHVLGKSREFLVAYPEYKVSKFVSWQVNKLFKKRKRGIPLAYLTDHKEFYGLDFLVNKHVLIPRPDTEIMVDLVVNRLRTTDDGEQIILIDVGTGSGCIPISILKDLQTYKLTNLQTFATDISRQALKVARKNAYKHNADINFLQGNLLEPILKNHELLAMNYELIITANLPYLTEEQFQNEPSIQHEPKSALVAKNNGLALYEELLNQIKQLLTTYYLPLTMYLEIDPSQSVQITKLIQTSLPNTSIEIKKDLARLDRVVVFSLGE